MNHPLAKLALTDKIAHASSASTRVVYHAARMVKSRVPSFASQAMKDNPPTTVGILCDRKSNGIGPMSRYHCISLQPGTLADVTCKRCRAILDQS